MENTIKALDKDKVVESLNERIKFFQSDSSGEYRARIKDLQDLLYVINKGCFDVDISNIVKQD